MRFTDWELIRLKYLSQGIEFLEIDFNTFVNSEEFNHLYYKPEVPESFEYVRIDFVLSVLEISKFTGSKMQFKLVLKDTERK